MAFNVNLEAVFSQWEQMGVFTIILPFLLVFAIVYGILTSTGFLGKDNKGVHVLVAIAVALISLRWSYFVSDFLSEVFPRLGVGLAVILTIMVLVGMFIAEDYSKYWGWGLGAIGGLIALIVIYKSFGSLGWIDSGFGNDMAGLIFLGLLLIGVIIAIGASSSRREGGERGRARYPGGMLHFDGH